MRKIFNVEVYACLKLYAIKFNKIHMYEHTVAQGEIFSATGKF